MTDSRGEVTALLAEARLGRKDALERILPLVYRELKAIARRQMRGERAGHTLQPTALVNEVYLRLMDQDHQDWLDRSHFLRIAAQMMRRLLVDYARRRNAGKRGIPITIHEEILPGRADKVEEILAVDQVLARLAELDQRLMQVVELRYFSGFSVEETAEVLDIDARTVKRDWALAKGWMKLQLGAGVAS